MIDNIPTMTAKLNESFTIHIINGDTHRWVPNGTVLYKFRGTDEQSKIVYIEQWFGRSSFWVNTIDGDNFKVPDLKSLYRDLILE